MRWCHHGRPAVIKDDVSIPCPEFMADTVIRSLTETGNRFSGFDVENPDALIHIIPRSLMTEHADVIVIRGKLKMAQLMGITKYIADIPAVNVHQCDAPVRNPEANFS